MSEMNLEKAVDKARTKLKAVQRADDKTKKFYLVVLSSLAMVVVIGLWFSYLNVTLPEPAGTDAEAVVESNAVTAEEPMGDSFFDVIVRGAESIISDFRSQFVKIGESLGKVKEFSFEGKDVEFAPEKPLKPTPLP